jgi:hypothetical protein
MQRRGYDDSNIIQFATITNARGEKEFGQPDILGQATTYQIIISRSISRSSTPFSMTDLMYGWQQTNPTSFY